LSDKFELREEIETGKTVLYKPVSYIIDFRNREGKIVGFWLCWNPLSTTNSRMCSEEITLERSILEKLQ
jgi:hypothetical protein